MRIVITLDIEGVEKDKTAIFVGEKPESPVAVFQTTEQPPVTLPAHSGAKLEVVAETDNETVIAHNEDGSATVIHEPAPAPKKRGRKRKTVDIGAAEKAPESEPAIKTDIGTPGVGPEPAPVAAPEPVPQAAIKAVISAPQVPICPTCKEPMAADERYDAFLCIKDGQFNNTVKPSQLIANVPKLGTPVVPEVKPSVTQAVLTEEEQKSIKARLGKYWVSILPEAGMTADDGKSINAKLTQFANNFAEGREWPNSRAWNAKQWDTFLGFMDGMVGAKGAKALVAHINQEIGSK